MSLSFLLRVILYSSLALSQSARALSTVIFWVLRASDRPESSNSASRSPFLTCEPSSITHLMVVAVVAFWLRALTLQVTSLFSADSRMPRSFTVIASLSFLTGAVRMSVRDARMLVSQYHAPAPLAPTRTTTMARMPSLAPVPRRLLRAIRDGLRLGEPFWPLGLSTTTPGWAIGSRGSAVTGCKLIGPHSSEVKRH